MPSKIRRRARSAAQPQVRSTRRQGRREVRALGSEGRALQQGISRARHDIVRVPGLSGRDQRIALEELAARRVDAASGIASQQSAVHADVRGAVTDLRQQAVSDLVQQQAAEQQAIAMAKLQAQLGHKYAVKEAKLGSRLDLKSALAQAAATGGDPKFTPLQKRAISQNRQNALSLVHDALRSPNNPFKPKSDKEWRQWADLLYSRNQTRVDHGDIQWAIKHLRNRQVSHGIRTLPDNPVIHALSSLFGH